MVSHFTLSVWQLASTAIMLAATFDSIAVPANGALPALLLNWMLLSRVRLPFVVPFEPDELDHVVQCSLREPDPLGVLRFVELQLATAVDECKTMCAQAMAGDMAAARAEANNAVTETCIVCLEEEPDIRMACCSANVHAKCLSTWLRNAPDPTCMQCRKVIDWS